jgi:hypothetical protein
VVSAVGGAVVVAAGFSAAGFWWPSGYHLVVQRYNQGWAAQRPYGYWVWADLACLVVSAGPVVGPALVYAVRGTGPLTSRAPVRWLPVAALLAIAAADLSGLSKAEVERIWLPYEFWLLTAAGALPPTGRRGWLAAQATVALVVNHLLLTNS